MADNENLDIVIRMRGGREAAAQARGVEQAIGGIGKATDKTVASTQAMGRETDHTSNAMIRAIGTTLRYATAYGALRVAGAAFAVGFRFDATMEQNTVAFTHFLGSAQAARTELANLYEIAATTPFEFSDITSVTRRFLAFGFSVGDANKELAIMGDAVAGIGGGREELNRLALVIGQIQAKGRLQGDELLQLAELGLIGPQQIAKEMGMAQNAFFKAVTAGKISSEQAITAINAVLVAQFKGSAEEQSRTLIGQLSTAKDYGAQAAGALVQPLVDFAQSSALPRMITFFRDAGTFLKSDSGQGLLGTLGQITQTLGPLIAAWIAYKAAVMGLNAALATYDALQVGAIIAGQISAALALAPAVTSLSEAWWLLNAAIEGTWLAALGPIGWAAAAIVAVTALYLKWQWFHNAVNDTFGFIWKIVKAIWSGVTALAKLTAAVGTGFGHAGGGLTAPLGTVLHKLGFMATGGTIPVGGAAVVGERGPELAINRGSGTEIIPGGAAASGGAPRWLQTVVVQVDGRTLSEVVMDHGMTAQARG